MKITPTEFLDFAKVNQDTEWNTIRGKGFQFTVGDGQIFVTPLSSGVERTVSESKVQEFCQGFSKTNSLKPSDYHEMSWCKSYLVAIAKQIVEKRNTA